MSMPTPPNFRPGGPERGPSRAPTGSPDRKPGQSTDTRPAGERLATRLAAARIPTATADTPAGARNLDFNLPISRSEQPQRGNFVSDATAARGEMNEAIDRHNADRTAGRVNPPSRTDSAVEKFVKTTGAELYTNPAQRQERAQQILEGRATGADRQRTQEIAGLKLTEARDPNDHSYTIQGKVNGHDVKIDFVNDANDPKLKADYQATVNGQPVGSSEAENLAKRFTSPLRDRKREEAKMRLDVV